MTLNAESNSAVTIATEEAAKSVSLLRLYHPAHLAPEITAYTTLLGYEHRRSYFAFVGSKGQAPTIKEATIDISSRDWFIDRKTLSDLRSLGLDTLSNTLKKEKLTDFEKKALRAINLYSEGILRHEIHERLIHYFAALESLLLKNSGEAIEQNISDRLIYCIGRTAEERRKIVRNVKDVYTNRSGFVHHGKVIEYSKDIEEFCHYMWLFFTGIAKSLPDFDSKEEFIKGLEEKKYSA